MLTNFLSFVVAVMLVIAPSGAFATSTVLGQAASNSTCSYPQPLDALQLAAHTTNYTVPAGGGKIKSWSYWAYFATTVAFEVWRPTTTPKTFKLIAITGSKTIAANSGTNTFSLGLRGIPVLAGDVIGIHMAMPVGTTDPFSCALYTSDPADQFAWVYDASLPRLGTVATFWGGPNQALVNVSAVLNS